MIIMKKLLIGAGAFLLLPLPVQAGQILPNLYARAYCESRAIGMTVTAAMTQATDESYISSGNPQQVEFNGTTTTTDVKADGSNQRRLYNAFFEEFNPRD